MFFLGGEALLKLIANRKSDRELRSQVPHFFESWYMDWKDKIAINVQDQHMGALHSLLNLATGILRANV